MPNQKTLRMEDMSDPFLRALCAANGFSVATINHDNDGLDIEIHCSGVLAPDSIIHSPRLEIQLKSSYSRIVVHNDGAITYSLEVKNYKWLISSNRLVPLILVVFHMPDDEDLWLEQTIDWLKIKKCAYWISLKGEQDTDNTETISIRIPGDHLLTKDSLMNIMLKISKGQPI